MSTIDLEISIIARVDYETNRRARRSVNIRDRLEVSIPSVAAKYAPSLFIALAKGQHRLPLGLRRLWYKGHTYSPVGISDRQLECYTVDDVRINAGNIIRVGAMIAPWKAKVGEPLLNSAAWSYNDGSVVDALPLNAATIIEDTRSATRERIQEIASDGLLFVDGILHHKRLMPRWSLYVTPKMHSHHTRLSLVGCFGADPPEPMAFAFRLDRDGDAEAFVARYGLTKPGRDYQVEIMHAAPDVYDGTPEVIDNAIAGAELFKLLSIEAFPFMRPEGFASISRFNALRHRLDLGDASAVHDVLREFDAMSERGFDGAPAPLRRRMEGLRQMTHEMVEGSLDFVPEPKQEFDHDEDLRDFRL